MHAFAAKCNHLSYARAASKPQHVGHSTCMLACVTSMQTFGLEYDLDLFNIVAVDDFNMGAMENKSLNIFNSR